MAMSKYVRPTDKVSFPVRLLKTEAEALRNGVITAATAVGPINEACQDFTVTMAREGIMTVNEDSNSPIPLSYPGFMEDVAALAVALSKPIDPDFKKRPSFYASEIIEGKKHSLSLHIAEDYRTKKSYIRCTVTIVDATKEELEWERSKMVAETIDASDVEWE